MSDFLTGKGYYIFKIKDIEGGNGALAAQKAYNAGITYIWIKILDGTWAYNQKPIYSNTGQLIGWEDTIIKPFIEEFRKLGIKVWGWQYLYLNYPELEAKAVNERMTDLDLDGFIIDAEIQAKNNAQYTSRYTSNLKLDVPVGLSSYRYPVLHQELNWGAFLAICDLVAPQVYWMGSTNSGQQLAQSYKEYREFLKTDLPYYPTGSAFCEHGWCATVDQVIKFMDTAKAMKFPTVNFWDWYNASKMPGMWDAIAEYQYSKPTLPPTPSPSAPPPGGCECPDEVIWNGTPIDFGNVTYSGQFIMKKEDE